MIDQQSNSEDKITKDQNTQGLHCGCVVPRVLIFITVPAKSASSPLPALTSSPASSVHSSSVNDEASSDQAQSSDVEGSSND